VRPALAVGVLVVASPARADVLAAPAPKLANADGHDEGYAHIQLGRVSALTISVETAPGTPVTFRAVQLPKGMTLAQAPHPEPRATLSWTPTEEDLGASDAIVEVTDGRDTVRKTIHYDVHDNWASALLPSAGASAYLPRAGTMVGVPLQLALFMWVRRNAASGASHGRVYAQIEPLHALHGERRAGAGFALGWDASLESAPRRRWLVPHYGLALGRAWHGQMPGGGVGYALPQLGAYLWASHGVFVHASAGFMVPFSSFREQMGARVSLGATFEL
jgi:hypothetical protein